MDLKFPKANIRFVVEYSFIKSWDNPIPVFVREEEEVTTLKMVKNPR